LCALAFTIHLSMLGETGLRHMAELNHAKAVQLADKLSAAGIEVLNESFFNEFTVKLNKPANDIVEKLAGQKILGGIPLSRMYPGDKDKEDLLLLACTETVTDEHIDALTQALSAALKGA